ncbi:EXS-like protein 1 [Elsinoe fawcettii]|nr:EXS-like protein 1 [Elsinoe fawcettii]
MKLQNGLTFNEREYQNEIIPEWRVKYLDYRTGKKKLKAVGRAIRNANKSPGNFAGPTPSPQVVNSRAPVFNFLSRNDQGSSDEEDADDEAGDDATGGGSSGPVPIPPRAANERSPLAQHGDNQGRNYGGMTRYGSIIGTPPDANDELDRTHSRLAPSLHLPGPAMENGGPQQGDSLQRPERAGRSGSAHSDNATHGSSLQHFKQRQTNNPHRLPSMFQPKRVNSLPGPPYDTPKRPLRERMLSFRFRSSANNQTPDSMPLEAYRELEARQNEFFEFLDGELKKIDGFYKDKEDEASNRLKTLREQLHIMRDRRMEEVTSADHSKRQSKMGPDTNGNSKGSKSSDSKVSDNPWMKPFDKAFDKAKLGHVGKTFEAMKDLGTPSGPSAVDLYRDYTKKPAQKDVSYRTAKHKLKIALAEYYRGLELLKSYALLNRTAFRKITKKYDKTVNAHPTGRYMSEKVSKAYFVNSEVIEGHMHAVEDLYSRYFERGNHKVAVSKLRAKVARAGEYSSSAFRTGVLLALGTVFGVEGIVYAAELLSDPDQTITLQTQFLLQIYGGYFLVVLIALFFCLACRTWHKNKVNYTFVFEFDTRRQILDWRQLTQMPCVFYLLLGLVGWLNFRRIGGDAMYLYWPVVLVAATVAIMLNPLPIFYPKSRQWFLATNWRLIFSGIYPVEFRDFFLGDLFCSLTYAMGNMETFFCLYHQRPMWSQPMVCSSSHSRLLGFLTCLPGIWRALQCIRRYKDTRNFFPHLVNCGKYFCTIAYYLTLSLYRMNHSTSAKALFIAFASVNALYVSVWDLVMDWSLMDPTAKHKFLRQNLAFKSTYPYYAAIVIDPIIRFNWILYAIYTEDPKHAAVVSFFVGFTEVCRRGMWMVFRVENEHCSNVGRFRAYRDAPLPYEEPDKSGSSTVVSRSPDESGDEQAQAKAQRITGEQAVAMEEGLPQAEHQHGGKEPRAPTTGADYRRAAANAPSENAELRRRKGQPVNDSPIAQALVRAGTLMHLAHTQDFERRRRPGLRDMNNEEEMDPDDSDNSDTELEEAAIERARGSNSGEPDTGKGR